LTPYHDNYDDDYDDDRHIWRKLGVGAALLAAFSAVGFFAFRAVGTAPDDSVVGADASVTAQTSADSDDAGSVLAEPGRSDPSPTTTTVVVTTTAPPSPTSTTTSTTTTTTSSTTSSTTAPERSAASSTTSSSTVPLRSTTTSVASKPTTTLPDGSVAPVVAIFDVDTITLAGSVASTQAAEHLAALAQANSKTPAAVINLLTIDPAIPEGVGVRIVELTSARFPPGSAEVAGAHAAELDRMAAVMEALSNTSLLVVGHADQIGDDERNQQLSEDRAAAVVDYLEDAGVQASRLASRAVGESDLLSLNSDTASLALNRRTEFILYGVLVGL